MSDHSHYPECKAIQIVKPHETLRLKKQTERQSVVKYHQVC